MKIRLAGLLLALGVLVVTSVAAHAQTQATAPPAPGPAPSASAGVQIPLPTPAPRGKRGSSQSTPAPSASPSGTPAPPQFTTLDGVWEVEVQTRAQTYYTHFHLRQSGDAGADVGGLWDWGGKPDKKYPLKGTFDGRLFKFTVNDGKKDWTFVGYIENYSDLVGMVSDGTTQTPFTAQHRKKEKLINSINPGLPY